ncbi:bifunctional hydroxymethylpyrimidine kinase/phosphomethylpyrimidine kinase [Mesorhizobium australicum]
MLSSAVTALLAIGSSLGASVRGAKHYVFDIIDKMR